MAMPKPPLDDLEFTTTPLPSKANPGFMSIEHAIANLQPQIAATLRVKFVLEAFTTHLPLTSQVWLLGPAQRAVAQYEERKRLAVQAQKQTSKWVRDVVARNRPLPYQS